MAVMTNGGGSVSFLCAFILMISETKGIHCEAHLRRGGLNRHAQPQCDWNTMASMMSCSSGCRWPCGSSRQADLPQFSDFTASVQFQSSARENTQSKGGTER